MNETSKDVFTEELEDVGSMDPQSNFDLPIWRTNCDDEENSEERIVTTNCDDEETECDCKNL